MNAIVFSSYIIFLFWIIFKNWNDNYGVLITFYLAVGVYSLPTLYAYLYDIKIFEYQNIYLTHENLYKYYFFLVASLLSVVFVQRLFGNFSASFRKYAIIKRNVSQARQNFFVTVYCFLLIYLTSYFLLYSDDFQWGREGNALGGNVYSILFRYFQVQFLLYVFCIGKTENDSLLHSMMKLASALLILIVATKAGARSDILYISLALFFYFVSQNYGSLASMSTLKLISYSLFSLIFLQFIYLSRTPDFELESFEIISIFLLNFNNFDLSRMVLLQDYLFPSATLIMSIQKEVVIPVEAVVSNVLNTFYGFKEPLLHDYVTAAYGLYFDRGTGIAYFLFTEGYNLCGIFGFIYNGIVWGALLFLMTFQYHLKDKEFARILSAVYIYFMVFLVRAQTGIVFKTFIFQVLPILCILYYFFGYRIIRQHDYSTRYKQQL